MRAFDRGLSRATNRHMGIHEGPAQVESKHQNHAQRGGHQPHRTRRIRYGGNLDSGCWVSSPVGVLALSGMVRRDGLPMVQLLADDGACCLSFLYSLLLSFTHFSLFSFLSPKKLAPPPLPTLSATHQKLTTTLISPAQISEITPRGKEFLFFSLFNIVGKASSFIGPIISSAIIDAMPSHHTSAPFYFLTALTIVSYGVIFFFVDLKESQREQERFLNEERKARRGLEGALGLGRGVG